jgi:hypothetical protein
LASYPGLLDCSWMEPAVPARTRSQTGLPVVSTLGPSPAVPSLSRRQAPDIRSVALLRAARQAVSGVDILYTLPKPGSRGGLRLRFLSPVSDNVVELMHSRVLLGAGPRRFELDFVLVWVLSAEEPALGLGSCGASLDRWEDGCGRMRTGVDATGRYRTDGTDAGGGRGRRGGGLRRIGRIRGDCLLPLALPLEGGLDPLEVCAVPVPDLCWVQLRLNCEPTANQLLNCSSAANQLLRVDACGMIGPAGTATV